MELIPDEIKAIKQWSYSFSLEELKRPTHYSYVSNGALTFKDAIDRAGTNRYIGFYVTPDDPYVLIDIDDVSDPTTPYEELPVPLANLIVSNNTYSEISPSGRGIRMVLKLESYSDKAKVEGKVFYIAAGYEKKKCQINFGQPWQTITGNATPYAVSEVATVTLSELKEIFNIRLKSDIKGESRDNPLTDSKVPNLSELSDALMTIPLDQNHRVVRAYEQTFNMGYQHYEFWIKVLMGLHNYATLTGKSVECLELAINWSETDPNTYEGEDAVHKHWRSFSNDTDTDIVSYRSVFGIAYGYRLFWPVPRKQSKEDKTLNRPLKPLNTEYSNYEALVKYYNLKFYRDENNINIIYMTGDEDIIQEYFIMHRVDAVYDEYYGPYTPDTLISSFHIFTQSKGFLGMSHGQIAAFIKNTLSQTRNTVNFIKMYFDTPYDKLPADYRIPQKYHESTTFGKLFDCFSIDYMTDAPETEYEIYKAYYRKWLMGLIRNIYYKNMKQTNNCVLLLTGREQIRKTSHFRYLLPDFMRDLIAFTTHSFANESGMRDVVKLSSTNLIVVWDELEQFLVTGAESNFKKIIDSNPQKIIDKYEVIETTVLPIAIYGATSNLREFKIGGEGSRRLFHIPVSWIDTDTMEKICWHKLINQLRDEAEWELGTSNKPPWLLSDEQLKYQADLHTLIRAKNTVDYLLEETFDFSKKLEIRDNGIISGVRSLQTDTTGRLLTVQQVYNMLERAGHSISNIKRPAMIKALDRLCGEYTDTKHRRIQLHSPRCEVYKGLAQQHQYKKYVLPPLKSRAPNAFKGVT